ncbi:MAG: hypothetical protein DI636_12640, partial [Pelagerythrobacter marensis]
MGAAGVVGRLFAARRLCEKRPAASRARRGPRTGLTNEGEMARLGTVILVIVLLLGGVWLW